MIMSSLIILILLFVRLACGYAASSVSANICALAGRSVLSEYNKELQARYGVFAVYSSDPALTRLSKFYVDESLPVGRGIVKLKETDVSASGEKYPALDTERFRKQVRKLTASAAIKDIEENGLLPAVKLSRTVKTAKLPSRLLGYSSRVLVSFSGGILQLSPQSVLEDEYIMAVCSNYRSSRPDTWLKLETEYILYGNGSDKENLACVRRSLYALRLAVNEGKYLTETGEAISSTAMAIAKTEEEVETIMNGGEADGLDYEAYLRILLGLLAKKEKLARLMDIMEINLQKIDKTDFAFRDYAYGFDLAVSFKSNGRKGQVLQTHVYN